MTILGPHPLPSATTEPITRGTAIAIPLIMTASQIASIDTVQIDHIVRRHTAFASYGALEAAMHQGYVPSTTCRSEALALALEARGWRVFRSQG